MRMYKWGLAFVAAIASKFASTHAQVLPLRPTPEQRPPSDLNFDAQLLVERVDVLVWYLHHEQVALAHLIMALLEGPHNEVAKDVISRCQGDFHFVRGKVKGVLARLPRAPVSVPLGGAPLSPAVRKVVLQAYKIASKDGCEVGMHHLFLALLNSPTFYRTLYNSGCNIEVFKREVVLAYRGKSTAFPGQATNETPEKNDFDFSQYGDDLTQKARNGKLQPVVGRTEEIDRIAQVLSRMLTKAPLLIGEPGVGKTAVIEGLAQRIVQGAVPDALRNRRIFALDLLTLSSGTSMRGEFEKRMRDIIKYLQNHRKDVILFIDEIHTLVGAGKSSGAMDATQMLKVPLARGEIVLVGATTLDEFKIHIEKDKAFCRRFQKIVIEAPSKERAAAILMQVKHSYERHHRVSVSEDVVDQIVNLTDQYMKHRSFPDKALDILDEVCSWRRLNFNKKVAVLKADLSKAKKAKGDDKPSPDEIDKMTKELEELEAEAARNNGILDVTPNDVAHVMSVATGIKMGKLSQDEVSKVLNLAEVLNARVVGQEEAVRAVSDAIAIQRAGLSPKNKPLGTFLFLGSSGVGKTELAKAIADEIFDSEKHLIRLDMVEFQEAHSISRLIGPPPGYMGNDEGGQLTEAVRQKPHSVVLFDEVENAHKNLWSLLLPMLDEGHLSDSKGVRVDFTNTLIILTSNIGQQAILEGYKEARALAGNALKASNQSEESSKDSSGSESGNSKSKTTLRQTGKSPQDVLARMRQKVLKEVLDYFKPQVIGRMSEIIIFAPLNERAMRGVLGLKLASLTKSLMQKGIEFRVTESAVAYILQRGWSSKYGARRLTKYLEHHLKPKLAPLLISSKLTQGDRVVLVRSKANPDNLNIVVCQLDENDECKPGTKYGFLLISEPPKPEPGKDEEEDPL